ncbi:MAG: prepilin-type N-terminal cleavage/methylation domain-containing protein [Christensenellales bacterium]
MRIAKDKRGFTLIELIVVVAIIAILIALIVPNVVRQLEKTQQVTCLGNIASLQREYYMEVVSGKNTDYQAAWKRVVDAHDGELSGTSLKGICPGGGDMTVLLADNGSISLVCSKHGNVIQREYIPSLVEGVKASASVQSYFQNKGAGSRLDSTARRDPNATAVPLIEDLERQGIPVDVGSWSVLYKGGGKYAYYWSATDISDTAQYHTGDKVAVTRYDGENFITGEAPIKMTSRGPGLPTYNILDLDNFKAQ